MKTSSTKQRTNPQLSLQTADPKLRLIDGEMWLARRLGKHGVLLVFHGDTTPEQRMARMREKIRSAGLETVICGHKDEKPIRYAEAFERLYGVPL